MLRRLLAPFAIVSLALFSGNAADASGPPATSARWLGSDPVGPLVEVDGSHGSGIRTPPDGACRSWGPRGSRWSELDALGHVVGEAQVSARERYAYTGCDELAMRPVSGRRGVGVYVESGAPYHAPDAARWQPDPSALASLTSLVEARQRGIVSLDPTAKIPFARRAFFFTWGGHAAAGARPAGTSEKRYAAVGGLSLVLCSWENGTWRVVHERKPARNRAVEKGATVLAVVDMNSDGLPELVVHELEDGGEWYGDVTLSERANGTWSAIRSGIFGSTA